MKDVENRCWVEIDLDMIRQNYRIYRRQLRPGQAIMAVVKADAYGHGDHEVTKALLEEGCRHFAVSNIQEALNVRALSDQAEILILGYTPPAYFHTLSEQGISQAVLSEEYAALLASCGEPIRCQFALDTGMNRIGLDADDPLDCERVIRSYSGQLSVEGLFTHLCVADSADPEQISFTKQQIQKFRAVADAVRDLALPDIHCLNTAGGLWHNEYGNLVRLGISLYGLKPDYENRLPEGIEPALTWKSVVSMVKQVHPGETIGYGRSFSVRREMTVATVPTGYADGYSRHLSNCGEVLLCGRRVPIVGRVCMDQLMLDVSGIPNVGIGEVVTLIGRDGGETLTADDMAQTIGTIGYEIVCAISKRVARKFCGESTEDRSR